MNASKTDYKKNIDYGYDAQCVISIYYALPKNEPSGGFFKDGKPINW